MTTQGAAEGSLHESGHEPGKETAREAVSAHYDTRLPKLPWSRRAQIPLIAAAVYSVIRTLGPTLRYEVLGWQHAERVYASGKQCVWAFWHRVIIPIAWWRRNHGVVVMNTTAFDGQWTRKVIEWLGFGTAQGSSSRGGLRGLAVMAKRLEEGLDCAFTIDGPRGPRYVAKPGPVMLARKTGCPVLVFHIGPFPVAHAICAHRHAVRAADLCAARCKPGDARGQARGDAEGTRAGSRYRGILVLFERRRAGKTSRRIQRVGRADILESV
jgi:lysophospholipid acyltransferase (LPLAT)-like uncharacterized protein